MSRRTQILIAAVLSVVVTAAGTYQVVHLKMVPDGVMAFWFPFTLIVDKLGVPGEVGNLVGFVQYPLFAPAFALGIQRRPTSIVIVTLVCIYLVSVVIAFKMA